MADDAAIDAGVDTAIDAVIRPRLVAARPELDAIAREVMRANAAAALFGKPATVKIGRYQLVREVGTGGAGIVFLATDPELGRPVAVKLIVAGDPAVRARAVAEGQALAKLSHPHVVQVFDVGVVEDRVYLVMELIQGESLRAYAQHASRRDVIRAYRQAGEGLVAAHDAGLVHRDFKPDNAMRGADGRVRVVDFGLAGAEGDPSFGGTPRYMAPEQTRGATVTTAADQYAFAASLAEAVSGAAPAAAASGPGRRARPSPSPSPGGAVTVVARPRRAVPASVATAATPSETAADETSASDSAASDGAVVEIATRDARAPLPRWLDAIVARGTAADPADRFPSMAALLRALANDPRARWRLRALIAAPIALGVIGFGIGQRGDDVKPCDDGSAAIAPAWTAERVAAAGDHVAGLGTAFATNSAPRVRAALTGYAGDWKKGHHAACVAARTEPSATVIDRRSACLASAKNQLGATIDVLAETSAERLADALRTVSELPHLARCADSAALISDIPPPAPDQVARVREISEAIDRARVLADAARPDAVDAAAAAVTAARTLGYRPLLAKALLLHGRALEASGARGASLEPLTEAVDLAIPVGDDPTAVEAYARAIRAHEPDDYAAVIAGMRTIRGLAERLGPSDRFASALLHNNAGRIEHATGNVDRAREELSTAAQLAREVTGPGAVELAWVGANLALVLDDPGERERLLGEAVAVARDRLGADHPLSLRLALMAGFGIADRDRSRAALRDACNRMAEIHPGLSPSVIDCSYQLGVLDVAAGDRTAARSSFAITLSARPGPDIDADHADLVAAAHAFAALLDGDGRRAREELEGLRARLAPTDDTVWYRLLVPADVELGLAELDASGGDRDGEQARVQRALGYLERAAAVSRVIAVQRRLEWVRSRLER